MFINNFIYFYIAICMILILFELVWSVYIKKYNTKMEQDKIKYKDTINSIVDYKSNIDINALSKELKNVNNLISFQNAFEEIQSENIRRDFMHEILPVFIYLNIYYANRKNEMEKAFFAYGVGEDLVINNANNANLLIETMYSFIYSKSIYCRANAIGAIFSIGKVNNVIKAIEIINTSQLEYNQNLLTHNLKKFSGNKKILAIELNKKFDTYSENIQIAIIRFLTQYNYIEENELINRLKDSYLSVNVKCEIMRFFQANKSEEAKKFLMSILENEEVIANDFTIMAIGTLGYYDDEEVISLLNKMKNSKDEMLLEAAHRSMEKMKSLNPA